MSLIVHSEPKAKINKIELKSFKFTTVTTGGTGNIIKQGNGQAKYYTENLNGCVTLEMIAIPSGKFMMGSSQSERASFIKDLNRYNRWDVEDIANQEQPQHQVRIKSFYMGKYEVTQAQWQAIMGNNPAWSKGYNLPVEGVSWNDAVEFCKRLSKKTGKKYNLPSEAEWEYACRAGTTTRFAYGDNITPELVNYNGNYPYGDAPKGVYREKTTTVGNFAPNGFGLYDMHGNVWEWCMDVFHNNYNGAPTDGSAWVDGDQTYRVLRGGSCYFYASFSRSSNRVRNTPDFTLNSYGFRVVVRE